MSRVRPYLHSPLARSLYGRILRDQQLRSIDKSLWYKVDFQQVTEELRDLFIQMGVDEDTEKFLEQSTEKSSWFGTQLFYAAVRLMLGWLVTRTSINGLLGRGSMYIFSPDQFQKLLGVHASWKGDYLLDLGAGDGHVTQIMATHFHHVHVTEVSPVMRRVLTKQGYKVLDVNHWTNSDVQYDLISVLNVLDRCDSPLTLLSTIAPKLTPGTGRLLVALVLPLRQYVESGRPYHLPSEEIPVRGETFEDQVLSLKDRVLKPAGYEVTSWTRLPYLCEGDIEQSFYWLDDAVLLLRYNGTETV